MANLTTISPSSIPQMNGTGNLPDENKLLDEMDVTGTAPATQGGAAGDDAQRTYLDLTEKIRGLNEAMSELPDRMLHAALRAMVEMESDRTLVEAAIRTARVFVNEELLQRFLGTCAAPYGRYWQDNAFTLDAFLQRPPKQWYVDRVVGVGDLVMLYGTSGEGKTHVALDLAFSCVTGTTFAESFTVARPLTVVYATGEGVGGLADRLRAVNQYYGANTGGRLVIFTDVPQLYDATQETGARAFLDAWRTMAEDGRLPESVDVVIIDTMHNATAGADENSAGDASIVQATLRTLRAELGCAVVLVHHANKNGGAERGSSAIRASCDTVVRSAKSDGKFKLTCEKLKDGQEWAAQAFDLVEVGDTGSVRIFWEGDAKSVTDGTRASGIDPRILEYLTENAGKFFTPDEVTRGIEHGSAITVHNRLRQLAAAGTVEKRTEPRTAADGAQRTMAVYGTLSTPTELELGRGW